MRAWRPSATQSVDDEHHHVTKKPDVEITNEDSPKATPSYKVHYDPKITKFEDDTYNSIKRARLENEASYTMNHHYVDEPPKLTLTDDSLPTKSIKDTRPTKSTLDSNNTRSTFESIPTSTTQESKPIRDVKVIKRTEEENGSEDPFTTKTSSSNFTTSDPKQESGDESSLARLGRENQTRILPESSTMRQATVPSSGTTQSEDSTVYSSLTPSVSKVQTLQGSATCHSPTMVISSFPNVLKLFVDSFRKMVV